VLHHAALEAPLIASTCYVFSDVWEFLVLSYYVSRARFVHNAVLPITLLSLLLFYPPLFYAHVPIVLLVIETFIFGTPTNS
jgi:hypothetical protein